MIAAFCTLGTLAAALPFFALFRGAVCARRGGGGRACRAVCRRFDILCACAAFRRSCRRPVRARAQTLCQNSAARHRALCQTVRVGAVCQCGGGGRGRICGEGRGNEVVGAFRRGGICACPRCGSCRARAFAARREGDRREIQTSLSARARRKARAVDDRDHRQLRQDGGQDLSRRDAVLALSRVRVAKELQHACRDMTRRFSSPRSARARGATSPRYAK